MRVLWTSHISLDMRRNDADRRRTALAEQRDGTPDGFTCPAETA